MTKNNTLDEWFDIERNFTAEIHADLTIALLSYKRYLNEKGVEVHESWDGQEENSHSFSFISSWWASLLQRKKKPTKIKERQIVLIVRPHSTLDPTSADELYSIITEAIESYSEVLEGLKRWKGDGNDGNGREGDLLGKKYRRMVWSHQSPNGGRKLIRPIVDDAIANWRVKSRSTARTGVSGR